MGGGALNDENTQSAQGWDIVLGNPPYGATYPNAHKELFKTIYASALSIKNIQKGSLDTFSLFIEMGFMLLTKINGLCSFIVPMSITASESMVGLHRILLENCKKIWVSSYGDRPQKIFKNAEQKVSIITFVKTLTPTQKLMMTKVNKRYATQQVNDVIKNLHFINGVDFVKKGRLPKISFSIEQGILQKIYSHTDSIKHYISTQGMPIYYRTSGNRYYNLITTFPTHSTKEKSFKVQKEYQKLIGAILSSNLYFWFRSIYSNQRDTYLYEFEMMPFPVDNFSQSSIQEIENIYNAFEADIEQKANFTLTGTKEYRLRKSKSFIDEIDCAICGAYGLSEKERDFVINYDIEFRID